MTTPPSRFPELLTERWNLAMDRAVGNAPRVAVLYSGGVDSSLVAVAARERAQVELVTVGVRDSADLRAGEDGARLLELPWIHREVARSDIDRTVGAETETLAGADPTSQAVLIGLALALEATPSSHGLCGQGADELFLGYAHFQGLSPEATAARRTEDLRRLRTDDWPRSITLARRRGRVLASPFLDADFVEDALRLPVGLLREGSGRKPLLRTLAERAGVPLELVRRPKKAFQYGSGIERLLRTRSAAAADP